MITYTCMIKNKFIGGIIMDKEIKEKLIEELEKSLKEAKEEGDEARAKRLKSTLDRLK